MGNQTDLVPDATDLRDGCDVPFLLPVQTYIFLWPRDGRGAIIQSFNDEVSYKGL
jgi:hypothetical protein